MKKFLLCKDDLYNFSVGFFMGSANVIPGVSGGTMLFIMGAFGKLMNALRDIASLETLKLLFKGEWKALFLRIQWRFLFTIGIGVLVSFATLAKLFVWLLENHRQMTLAFFFGLVAASIITVNRQMQKWTTGSVISLIISAIAAFGVVSLVPVNAGSQWYMMMLYGAICIIAMILPGLSGSFLLLIFGQYDRIWTAVANAAHFNWNSDDIFMFIFLGTGCIVGLGAFVHLLNYLMKKFYNQTVAALIGFMIGAIPRIWPWQHETPAGQLVYDAPQWNIGICFTLLCAIAGLILVLVIEMLARKRTAKE